MKSAEALARYGSGHKRAGRTDNAKTISLRLSRGIINCTKGILYSMVKEE